MLPTLVLSLLPIVLAGPLSTPTPTAPKEYPNCGGIAPTPGVCAEPAVCIPDPRTKLTPVVRPNICVEPIFCGGFAGFKCEDGLTCYDDPRDSCDPKHGGADCGGICL
ncbi:uncharacterized protein DNG_01716 [Cephalotrichum gorgonifer]|uniref:EGF-like domain-containing protein n=1 Tax=Cephalotrichum gorgonifer TaxID=2041049 RepID=A0AAE8MRD8_9PEZI|nr:uncharacterized protein DNG_01716 [Cephalotrichum gorgonifer]